MNRPNQNSIAIILLTLLVSLAFSGCSTQKNTQTNRAYHQFTTRYNVYFNATNYYNTGIKAIQSNNQDDYSQPIPMYPISNHNNVTVATGDMDHTIEKCRKAIKNHSITKKPKKDSKKLGKADYKLFLAQDEFVPGVRQAWITLGKAELHKGDFIGAVGTFSYLIKHYPHHPETVTEAKLWLTRAYGELGWLYEAEQAFSQIKESEVSRKQTGLYAETKAYLLLLEKDYRTSIPFLKMAAEKSHNRYQTTRYYYLLGQLNQMQGNKQEAIGYYKQVKKMNPPYLMQFNANLEQFQLEAGHNPKAIKGLEKMAKNSNNKSYKDQIYFTIGNIYLERRDTARALSAYQKGVDESTRNGVDKALLLIKMGDLNYAQRQYVKAEPCYTAAALIINNSFDDYERVSKLSENLGQLATYAGTIELQDSLQALSKLSAEEQRKVVDNIIKQVIADEEAAKKKAQEEKDILLANTPSGGTTQNTGAGTINTAGGAMGGNADWYFYNQVLITGGKTQFQQKWGTRKLEDNWRRQNKSSIPDENSLAEQDENDNSTLDTDSLNNQDGGDDKNIADNKSPEFYLAQIPKTEEQINASNQEIATALYALAELYDSKLEDYYMSTQTFAEFQRRFPNDDRKLESYYNCYRLYAKQGMEQEQTDYRNKIVNEFPTSTYALMLSQPDYVEKVNQMYARQDSIYQTTYDAYTRSDFSTVFVNYQLMVKNYPMSPLMPKFSFLNALSLGKSSSETELYDALDTLVKSYPHSDVISMAKDILALRKQGLNATQGTAHGNLLAKRDAAADSAKVEPPSDKHFDTDLKRQHYFVLVPKKDDKQQLNGLLYDLAAYNFTKFVIKQFDVEIKKEDNGYCIVVSGFSNYDEAKWYENGLLGEPMFQGRITMDQCNRRIISDNNLKLIDNLGWDAYDTFCKESSSTGKQKRK